MHPLLDIFNILAARNLAQAARAFGAEDEARSQATLAARVARLARLRRSGWSAWTVWLICFGVAAAAHFAFAQAPFAPFLAAIVVVTLLCDWRKSLVLVTAAVILDRLHLSVAPETYIFASTYTVRVLAFVLLSFLLTGLMEAFAQAVLQLERSAELNADLFRELQHRVSNNFQIVAAMLQRARRGVEDADALDALDDAISRVHSLAHLHRRLYDPKTYGGGIEPILREVLAQTLQDLEVELRLHIEGRGLSVGKMTAITLLVNEAAINAGKHVFRPRRGRTFSVFLRSDGSKASLIVCDDGPGFAKIENDDRSRYGLSVMRGLATQLGGALEAFNDPGATLRVVFDK